MQELFFNRRMPKGHGRRCSSEETCMSFVEPAEGADCNVNAFVKCEYESEELATPESTTNRPSIPLSDDGSDLQDTNVTHSGQTNLADDALPKVVSSQASCIPSKAERRPLKGVKSVHCPLCNQGFKTPKKMNQHCCKAGIKYPCEICGKFFANTSSRNAHIRLHSGFTYKCETCGKRLTSKNSYVSHQQRHLGVKPYVCDFCDKGFVKKNYLVEHRRVHLDIRPYTCETCGKSFTRNTHLAMHQGSHVIMFSCDVCKKTFTRKGQLGQHKRVHTGEKPYKCDVCGKCYTRKTHLQTHRNTHAEPE